MFHGAHQPRLTRGPGCRPRQAGTRRGRLAPALGGGAAASSIFTEVASVTASSDVSALSTGAITLDATKEYLVVAGIDHQAAATQSKLYLNADVTDANYDHGSLNSAGTSANTTGGAASTSAAGAETTIVARLAVVNGDAVLFSQSHSDAASYHLEAYSVRNDAMSPVNEVQITGDVASGTYLRVLDLGGNLTNVVDESVSGGAVDEFATSSFSLTDGELYQYRIYLTNAVAGGRSFNYYFNSDTTGTNYRRGLCYSGGQTNSNSSTVLTLAANANGYSTGWIMQFGGRVFMWGNDLRQSSTVRWAASSMWNEAGTPIAALTQLRIKGGAGTIANGTRIVIDHVDATPFASVAAESTVTTIDTGAFAAKVSASDEIALVCGGINHTGAATKSQTYANGDTTGTNYNRGFLFSSSGLGAESTAAHAVETAAAEQSVFAGFVVRRPTGAIVLNTIEAANRNSHRASMQSVDNSGQTSLTRLQATCDTASGMESGSLLKAWS